jgi:hypothetical protein
MWRNNKLLEEIRRNQLSPTERAAEDEVDRIMRTRRLIVMAVLLAWFLALAVFQHLPK